MSHPASKRTRTTYAGRVVYDRKEHKFNTADVLRVIRNADPPELTPEIAGRFAAEIWAYYLHGLYSLITRGVVDASIWSVLVDVAGSSVQLAIDFGRFLPGIDVADFLINLRNRFFK